MKANTGFIIQYFCFYNRDEINVMSFQKPTFVLSREIHKVTKYSTVFPHTIQEGYILMWVCKEITLVKVKNGKLKHL